MLDETRVAYAPTQCYTSRGQKNTVGGALYYRRGDHQSIGGEGAYLTIAEVLGLLGGHSNRNAECYLSTAALRILIGGEVTPDSIADTSATKCCNLHNLASRVQLRVL